MFNNLKGWWIGWAVGLMFALVLVSIVSVIWPWMLGSGAFGFIAGITCSMLGGSLGESYIR